MLNHTMQIFVSHQRVQIIIFLEICHNLVHIFYSLHIVADAGEGFRIK